MKSTETSPSAQVLKKPQPEEFALVILGGGTGSTVAAWTFAGEGKRVAVVDHKYIGGSCPNLICRVHFGRRAIRCSENCGSHPGRWDHTSITERECDRQYGHAGRGGTNSWPCGSTTAPAHRGA
jgi:hypothetical protein